MFIAFNCQSFGCTVSSNSEVSEKVYFRIKVEAKDQLPYSFDAKVYRHKAPWRPKLGHFPKGAKKNKLLKIKNGQFSEWIDLSGKDILHECLNRSGGKSEFPSIELSFPKENNGNKKLTIQLATSPSEQSIVKTIKESFVGLKTVFLVSPNLKKDAELLESASQSTERRLKWAKDASGGKRIAPKNLIFQTTMYGHLRPDLERKEAEIINLLGFNTVAKQSDIFRNSFNFSETTHTHSTKIDFVSTHKKRSELVQNLKKNKSQEKYSVFYINDEITAAKIEGNSNAIADYKSWVKGTKFNKKKLKLKRWSNLEPVETPQELKTFNRKDQANANRLFYHTARYRQLRSIELLNEYSVKIKQQFPGIKTSSLTASHPYFAGSGLGMGMKKNGAWGGHPLSLDWFEIGRSKPVDIIGVEDWLGLQYMYGPYFTWEGFQLLGFQSAIFRSASNGDLPIMTWITPSDETNIRLKFGSALCQGSKHFYFWAYGPTEISTENYWSDNRSSYNGIVNSARKLAFAEDLLQHGKLRKTKVAILYSVSSDLWQPFGYAQMLERRGLYFSLTHDQFGVDFLSEEDIENGELNNYEILYTSDPCIKETAIEKISKWVKNGGTIVGTCAAGSRNEYNENISGLAEVFGINPKIKIKKIEANYRQRAQLNKAKYTDFISIGKSKIGTLGVKINAKAKKAKVTGRFSDNTPAYFINSFGKGKAYYYASCPGISYIKEANFVLDKLEEKWQPDIRNFINTFARKKTTPILKSSVAVVETGVYDSKNGSTVILTNFNYSPINNLSLKIPVSAIPKKVDSFEKGEIKYKINKTDSKEFPHEISFQTSLTKLNDIIKIYY